MLAGLGGLLLVGLICLSLVGCLGFIVGWLCTVDLCGVFVWFVVIVIGLF